MRQRQRQTQRDTHTQTQTQRARQRETETESSSFPIRSSRGSWERGAERSRDRCENARVLLIRIILQVLLMPSNLLSPVNYSVCHSHWHDTVSYENKQEQQTNKQIQAEKIREKTSVHKQKTKTKTKQKTENTYQCTSRKRQQKTPINA